LCVDVHHASDLLIACGASWLFMPDFCSCIMALTYFLLVVHHGSDLLFACVCIMALTSFLLVVLL